MNHCFGKRARRFLCAASLPICLSAVSAGEPPVQETVPVEIQTFWSSPAEIAARDVLKQAYEIRGGRWVGYSTANHLENRSTALRRILEGVPPFAVQWHAGEDLRILSRSAVLYDLSPIAEADHWARKLQPQVLRYIESGKGIYALPISIHAENWTWINKTVMSTYTDAAPSSWTGLIALLARMRADGKYGIAMGNQSWQRMLLFTAILASEDGEGVYRDLINRGNVEALNDYRLRTTMNILGQLRAFDQKSPEIRRWDEATAAVANGRALVQFMGDWALRELTGQGLVADQDFLCVLSLGREERHISVIDVLIFPMAEGIGLIPQHFKMADAILADKTQIEFSDRKGAIPVTTGIVKSINDPCIAKGYALFSKPGASIPAPSTLANERFLAVVERKISKFWDSPAMDSEAIISELRDELRGH